MHAWLAPGVMVQVERQQQVDMGVLLGFSSDAQAQVLHTGKAADSVFAGCAVHVFTVLAHCHLCTGDLAILQCKTLERPPQDMVISDYQGPGSEVLKRLMTTPVS
jgi:hypothetical protein